MNVNLLGYEFNSYNKDLNIHSTIEAKNERKKSFI